MPENHEVIGLVNQASGVFNGKPMRMYYPVSGSDDVIRRLCVLLCSGDQKIKKLIINESQGGVLIHLAREIGSNLSLEESRPILFYLVPKIMEQPLSEQERAFKRHTNQRRHPLDGEIIETDDPRKNNHYLDVGEFGFAHLMYKLKIKADSLDDRKEIDARDAANRLHQDLSKCFLEYLDSSEINEVAYDHFKDIAISAIKREKPELEKQRGWKNFLVNLALFIVTLGVAHVGAVIAEKITGKKYTDRQGLFSLTKTASAHLADDLEQNINKMR